ncbi:MAG: 4Fe-4S cluster-binding domain-containing protein, partial [Anaerolineaceae bacterium]|nr:4Fe-4S cluster-binding domain-containing protein [Anaerolineaceae bacterium]
MTSIKPLHPTDLGLILTYKCQSACAHCLYNCGPGWNDWMSQQDVRDALEATLIWSQPFQVHITGGEPFLNYPLLLHAVETAASLGINRYLETNAGWCVNEELVTRQFNSLLEAGLQAILISCSPFHAATIPPKRTLLAIRKAIEIFGLQRVMVYLPQWLDQITSIDVEDIIPL